MLRKALSVLALLVLLSSNKLHSQNYDTVCVHELLSFLENSQTLKNSNFPKGLFPSYRQYYRRPNVLKDDDNMFFTGLIVFTLNQIAPKLDAKSQEIIKSINQKAIPTFELFKNKNGELTYNFWQTNPPRIFPNSGWMNWFNKSQSLPDDFDDTSIGLMARKADTTSASEVHKYMQSFTNKPEKKIRNTLSRYKNIPAYSVWFGQKFPIDFDISVACNILYFVSAYRLKWTAADSATLTMIEEMIKRKDYINHPGIISPHYNTTANILYHISRLMGIRPDLLSDYKQELIKETKSRYQQSNNPVEKAMLATSLKRWGIKTEVAISDKICSKPLSDAAYSNFVFFIANMPSMLPTSMKKAIGQTGVGKFNYYCPAYNMALILESMVE